MFTWMHATNSFSTEVRFDRIPGTVPSHSPLASTQGVFFHSSNTADIFHNVITCIVQYRSFDFTNRLC